MRTAAAFLIRRLSASAGTAHCSRGLSSQLHGELQEAWLLSICIQVWVLLERTEWQSVTDPVCCVSRTSSCTGTVWNDKHRPAQLWGMHSSNGWGVPRRRGVFLTPHSAHCPADRHLPSCYLLFMDLLAAPRWLHLDRTPSC